MTSFGDYYNQINAAATVDGVSLTENGIFGNGQTINDCVNDKDHVADVALSDVCPSTTPYTGFEFTALHDTVVGVVPFVWVKGAYTPDGTTASAVPGGYPGVGNISSVQVQELLGGGLALNQFTGNAPDQAIFAQVVGGDHNSGTRLAAILDTQYGNFFAAILQLIANGQTVSTAQFGAQRAGNGVISTLAPWPTEIVDGENRAAGNEGFSSDSYIAYTLGRPCDTSQGNYIISYLGMTDAQRVNPGAGYSYTDGAGNTSIISPSQNALTFDGDYPGTAAHPFGPPYTNVEQGNYTFWGYEHYLYSAYLPAGNLKTVADQVATQLTSEADYSGSGILLSAMNASCITDGAPVTSP